MQQLVIPELLGGAWNLMKSRFVPLALIALIGAVPGWVAQVGEAAIGLPLTVFALPITLPVGMVAYGAGLAVAHAQLFRNQAWGVGEGFGFAFSKALPLLGVAILQGLAIMLGTCLCIVPGVIAFLALCAAVPLVLFDDVPVVESFSQSYNLTRGSWLPIFVVFLVAMLIIILPITIGACVLGVGAGIAAGEQGMMASSGWSNVLISLLFAPVTIAGGAYFNSLYIVVYRALLRRQGRTDEQIIDVFA